MKHEVKQAVSAEEIERIIGLRYEVLRKPWNQPIDTATDAQEMESVNAYIEEDGEVIACARLQNNGKGVGQVRFMAVSPNQQGKGLGNVVLVFLETRAKEMGLHTIELQARENAVAFYERNGYTIKETSYRLWDIIQHYLMTKSLSPL